MSLVVCNSREEFHQKVKDAEVVYGDVRADTLQVAKKLQWVQSSEAGMENMDPAMRQSPVVLTNYQRIFAARHFGNRHGHAAVSDARHRQVLHAAVL
jgi:phosphoglycerate dehydrogenase-like enzyme